MNKQEFLKKVAEKAKMSQTDANRCLSAVVDVIVSEVRDNGEQITIPGLGTFKQVKRDAHEGRNPLNGEKVQIKASRNLQLKVQSSLKVKED